MSACGRIPGGKEALEAFVAGTLAPAQAAKTRAHVASCHRCAKEAAWLRAEARLFVARAAFPGRVAARPPPFAVVRAAARQGGSRTSWWSLGCVGGRVPWPAMVAAAAVAAVFVTRRAPSRSEAAYEPIVIAPYEAQTAGEPSLRDEVAAYVTEHALAAADDRYGECLAAPSFTMGAPPPNPRSGLFTMCASAPEPLTLDTDVTHGPESRLGYSSAGAPRSFEDEARDEGYGSTIVR